MDACEIPVESARPLDRLVDFRRSSEGAQRAIREEEPRDGAPRVIFPALWLFIGLVSAFDTYLLVRFQEDLVRLEVNPMARVLLALAGGEPSLLVGVKFMGSVLVLGILTALHVQNRRIGLIVTAALASFQLGLLSYLVFV